MVYVTQEQEGKNIVSALKYGEITVLVSSSTQVGLSAGQVTREIDAKLSNFNDNDFLLLIGDPIIIGIAIAMAGKWNRGKVKVLKWDRQEHVYYPVSLNFFEKGDTNGPDFA